MLQSCYNAHVEPLLSLADGGIDHTIFGWILGEGMPFFMWPIWKKTQILLLLGWKHF